MIFANDRYGPESAYLRDLVTERRRIEEALEAAVRGGLCRLEVDFNVTHDRFFDDLTEHHDDIVGVHFAGHADPSGLQFEDERGHQVPARMAGIAQALARLPALRWVFLNGCGTAAHVEALQGHVDAPLVVTEHAIADAAAAGFARRFYHALGRGRTLREAFDLADSELKSQCGAPGEAVRATAGRMRMLRPAETAGPDWPWVLAVPDGAPERADWRLLPSPRPTSTSSSTVAPPPDDLGTTLEPSGLPSVTAPAPYAPVSVAPVGPPEHRPFAGIPASRGACPSCEVPGPVGTPCETERCRRFACHRIPPDFVDRGRPLPDPLCGQLWGSYLLVSKLGEGGVGAVYLALQQPVGLRTALKVLHARRSKGVLAERFVSEAQALARLVHPNIVRLLGSGTVGDQAYIAMEYIDGGRTLADALAAGIELAAARRILLQMVDALESAHRADVVHRDIKPANVMLQATGREPYFVRIVDFGLVKFTDDGESTELAAGTPIYMAPEQIRRTEIGPWTDWYAVGVIACELLAGRRPFPPMKSHALMRLKVAGELDPLAELAELDLPAPVQHLLVRTLAFEPRERPQTAGEMSALIEAAFEAMPGPLPRPPPERSAVPEPSSGTSNHYGVVVEAAALDAPRRGPWWALVAALTVAALGGWWLMVERAGSDPGARASAAAARDPAALPADPSAPGAVATVADAALAAQRGPADASAEDPAPDATADAASDAAPDAAPMAAPQAAPPPARHRKARRATPSRARPTPSPKPTPKPETAPSPAAERLDIEVL